MANKISTVLDLDGKGFVSQLQTVRANVQQADGAMGKLKAGASGLGGILKQNLAAAATAAGGALVTFGIQAVNAFQDAALEAGRFADATGIAVEDASRLMEVAGDLGIETSTLEGAFLRFNKAAGDGKLDEFTDQLVRGKDGAIDAYQSFVNIAPAIGAIADPTERARKAQEVFGRSYGQIAELMEMSAEDVRAALDDVSDAKVIDEQELQRARRFRAAMDDLKDTLEDVQLTVGERLGPQLTTMAGVIGKIGDALGALPDPAEKFLFGPSPEEMEVLNVWLGFTEAAHENLGVLSKDLEVADKSLDTFTGTFETAEDVAARYERAAEDAGDATESFSDRVEDADDALSELKGNLDDRQAWRNVQDSVEELREKIGDNESSWRDLSEASDDAIGSVADYVSGLDTIPPEVKSQIYTELDQGNLDLVLGWLDKFQAGVDIPVRWKLPQGASVNQSGQVVGFGGRIIAGATGGIVNRPTMAMIGEAGPEAVIPLNQSPGNSPLPALGLGGGGNTYNVTIQAGFGVNGTQLGAEFVKAIKAYERVNGKGWRT